jgi:hypothetical protein
VSNSNFFGNSFVTADQLVQISVERKIPFVKDLTTPDYPLALRPVIFENPERFV